MPCENAHLVITFVSQPSWRKERTHLDADQTACATLIGLITIPQHKSKLTPRATQQRLCKTHSRKQSSRQKPAGQTSPTSSAHTRALILYKYIRNGRALHHDADYPPSKSNNIRHQPCLLAFAINWTKPLQRSRESRPVKTAYLPRAR